MTGKQTELFISIALFLLLTGSARAATIWGVTVNKNMSDPDSRSEVFTIDTETQTVTNLHTTTLDEYNLGRNYSDIAITASGGVYAIGSDYKGGGSFFEDLFRLDPTTGLATEAWHNVNLRGKPINGLTALDETTLLAVEGGRAGIVHPHLIQINLDPVTGGFVDAADLGKIDTKPGPSGGDIVKSNNSGVFIAALGGGDDFYRIDISNPDSAWVDFTTDRSMVAGLAYDYDADSGAALIAGLRSDKTLYTIDPVTGGTLPSYDLGGYVKWNTAGLDSAGVSASNVPEPSTVLLLGLGSLAFFRNRPF